MLSLDDTFLNESNDFPMEVIHYLPTHDDLYFMQVIENQ